MGGEQRRDSPIARLTQALATGGIQELGAGDRRMVVNSGEPKKQATNTKEHLLKVVALALFVLPTTVFVAFLVGGAPFTLTATITASVILLLIALLSRPRDGRLIRLPPNERDAERAKQMRVAGIVIILSGIAGSVLTFLSGLATLSFVIALSSIIGGFSSILAGKKLSKNYTEFTKRQK